MAVKCVTCSTSLSLNPRSLRKLPAPHLLPSKRMRRTLNIRTVQKLSGVSEDSRPGASPGSSAYYLFNMRELLELFMT